MIKAILLLFIILLTTTTYSQVINKEDKDLPRTIKNIDKQADSQATLDYYVITKSEKKLFNVNKLNEVTRELPPRSYTEKINGIKFKMIYVQGGILETLREDNDSEKPVYKIELNGYFMSETEVTVELYMNFVNETQSHYPEWLEEGGGYNIKTGRDDYYKKLGDALQNPKNPIIGISWYNAVAFCEWLNQKTGKEYRLPTEAEWEFAARGGTEEQYTKWAGIDSESSLTAYAWLKNNSNSKPHPVKQKQPNELGLYDMSGNVDEWCSNWYTEDYYKTTTEFSFQSPNPRAKIRTLRGGSWGRDPLSILVTSRRGTIPDSKSIYYGFRLCRSK